MADTRTTTRLFKKKTNRASIRKAIIQKLEYALDLFLEDKRVVVHVSAIFIIVKFECRDLSRDPDACVAADAEIRSVHGGGPPIRIPY